MTGLTEAALAFVVSLALSPLVLWGLRRIRLLDPPTFRSSHRIATPRGGGLAPAIACIAALLAASDIPSHQQSSILWPAAGMGCIGMLDDLRNLDPRLRLAGQLVVATASATILVQRLRGPMVWRISFFVGVVVWLVGYVNAFNFMDGINGIAVAQMLVAGIAWWVVAASQHVAALAAVATIGAAAALAFAPFNTPVARMFLGDVGSYFLGGWLAAAAVVGLRAGLPPEAVVAPLALFIADTATTLLRRLRRREVWYHAHREHAYQQLVDAGWSHTQTALVVAGHIALVSALASLSLTGIVILRCLGDGLAAVVLYLYLALPSRLARRHQGGNGVPLVL